MRGVYLKEISSYFSSLIGYIVIGIFLTLLGLMLWVFPESSILNYEYVSLDQLFIVIPFLFMFIIPAVTMSSFAEERGSGTLELLTTKPISDLEIVLGKYFANLTLVLFMLIPTGIYYYSVYQLGFPKGNLDSGAVMGSYIGLFLLASIFVAIGVFASSLTRNQIVSFVLATFLSFFFYLAFYYFSELPVFMGTWELYIQKMGIEYHYQSISKGLIDSRDVIYFLSLSSLFIFFTVLSLRILKE